MEISANGSVTVTVRLDPEEGWTAYNERNRPFRVWTITYSGSSEVSLAGWAILKDSSEGATQRYGRIKFRALPIRLAAPIAAAHYYKLAELMDKVKK